ncbi:MAG: ABC transporter ATP-binding protein [Thermoleophilaceae bacterium]
MLRLVLTFRHFLLPYRRRLAFGMVALALSVAADLAQPWPLKVIVDSVLGHHRLPSWAPAFLRGGSTDVRIGVLCAAMLTIVGFGGLVQYLGTYWSQSIGQRVMFDVRDAVHSHLHRLSLSYHHSQQPGDLANRLTADVDRIQDVVISVAVNLVTGVLTLAGMLAIMLLVSWRFTLLALIMAPLLFALVFTYTNRIKWSSRRTRRQEGQVAAAVQESLSAIHLVQAYSREEHERERFRREAANSLESGIRATALQARFSPLVDFLTAVATVMVLWVGAHEVLRGRLTLGLLLVFLSYLGSFYKPMRQLSKLSYMVSRGTAAAERLSEVMDAEPALSTPARAYRPSRVAGTVTFDDVHFRYPTADQETLHGVSFAAEPGQVVALIGPTGAGKSTVLSLIPRFYDVSAGAVRVDGVDVREWGLRELRAQVSLVLQETWLFQASVLDNIAYGQPGASYEDVVRVATDAHVDEFIGRLPDGYETVVGPRGATLSGGQRQRIAIARAMLRSAPILILDEPTTGLDFRSERLVLEALGRLTAERTTFVISHSEAPIVAAEQLLAIDGGRIVESHDYYEGLRQTGRRRRQPLPSIGEASS